MPFKTVNPAHINLSWKTPDEAARCMTQFEETIAPMMRGLLWEFHVDETPRAYWSIEGFRPRPVDQKPRSGGRAKTGHRRISRRRCTGWGCCPVPPTRLL
jgi:hypothetical protein